MLKTLTDAIGQRITKIDVDVNKDGQPQSIAILCEDVMISLFPHHRSLEDFDAFIEPLVNSLIKK